MVKVFKIIGQVLTLILILGFIFGGMYLIIEGAKNKIEVAEQTTEENQLIEATVIGVGTEYNVNLELSVLCQDLKGHYWKFETSETMSKGQNVILEVDKNNKIINVWKK
jgi:hypothetical protein